MAQLAGNPTITLGGALNAPTLPWTTFGDTIWSMQKRPILLTVPRRLQSGPVTNEQMSVISTTVNGPGTVTFAWSSQAGNNDGDGNFSYEFDIDDNYNDSLGGNTDWQTDGPFDVPVGTHTLTWTTYANGDTDPTELGFLDNVIFTLNQPDGFDQSVQVSGPEFQFDFQTKSGFSYIVQYCTDLTVGDWARFHVHQRGRYGQNHLRAVVLFHRLPAGLRAGGAAVSNH